MRDFGACRRATPRLCLNAARWIRAVIGRMRGRSVAGIPQLLLRELYESVDQPRPELFLRVDERERPRQPRLQRHGHQVAELLLLLDRELREDREAGARGDD